MASQSNAPRVIRFGLFEVDFSAGELRKQQRNIKLQGQPFQVLEQLLSRPGDVLTREELRRALWPADTFVEFDQGLNTAIKKIRLALGDSADNPRFIETIPRKGYRFIAPVDGKNPAAMRTPAPGGRRHVLFASVSFCFTVCVVSAGWWLHTNRMPAPQYLTIPLTSYPGNESQPAFSPDGNQVAFVWKRTGTLETSQIFVKLIGTDAPVPLTQGQGPAWSPNGRYIAFLRSLPDDRSGVYLIPVSGGSASKVAEVWTPAEIETPYLSWHPAGNWLVVMDKDAADKPFALFLVSVKTGERRRLSTPLPGTRGDLNPAVSADGGAVAFIRAAHGLFLQELTQDPSPKGQPVRLTSGNQYTASPAWTADGRAIVFSSGTPHRPSLYKVVLSRPERRAAKPERLPFSNGARQATISRQGQLAYATFTIDANIWRLRLNNGFPATEPPAKLIASTHLDHMPRYSPDGLRIAFGSNRSGFNEIWVCNSDGSGTRQLTSFGGPMTTGPYLWSPDGGQILLSSRVQDNFEDFVINSEGGTPTRITGKSVSQNGKWLYLNVQGPGGAPPWKVPARDAQLSPDGRFLYYPKDGNEFTSLWRVPVDGGEATQVLESVCCRNFTVVVNGIYFIPKPPIRDNGSIRFLSFATGKVTTIAKLSGLAAFGSSVSPDGRWLLYSQYEQKDADLMLVEHFQ